MKVLGLKEGRELKSNFGKPKIIVPKEAFNKNDFNYIIDFLKEFEIEFSSLIPDRACHCHGLLVVSRSYYLKNQILLTEFQNNFPFFYIISFGTQAKNSNKAKSAKILPEKIIKIYSKRDFEIYAPLYTLKASREFDQEHFNKLDRLISQINSHMDYEKVFFAICKAATELLAVDHSGIVEFDNCGKFGVYFSEYPIIDDIDMPKFVVAGNKLEEALVYNKNMVVINDVEKANIDDSIKNIFTKMGIKSSIIIPIIINGKVAASISFDSMNTVKYFSEFEIDLAQMFSNHIAQTIKNARLVYELLMVNSVSRNLHEAATVSLDDLFTVLGKEILRVMPQSNIYIASYDQETNTIDFPWSKDKNSEEDPKQRELLKKQFAKRQFGNGLTEFVIKNKDVVLINNNVDVWCKKNKIDRIGVKAKSWIGVPIQTPEKVLAVIGLQNYDFENAFDEEDVRFLKTLAEQTALALNVYDLYYDEKQLKKEALFFLKLARITAEEVGVKNTAIRILEVLEEMVTFKRARVIIIDENKREVIARLGYESENYAAHESHQDGLIENVLCERKMIIWSNTSGDNSRPFQKLENGVHSWIGIPLTYGESIVGVIAVEDDRPMYYNKDTEKLLASFSIQSGIAIQNAKLEEQRYYAQEMLLETAKLANPGFIAIDFSHNAKHVMNDINTSISMLIDEIPASTRKTSKLINDIIAHLIKQTDYLKRMFGSLVSYAKQKKMTIEKVQVKNIIDDVKYLFEPIFDRYKIVLELDLSSAKNATIECDKTQIIQVFINLFNNSIFVLKPKSQAKVIRISAKLIPGSERGKERVEIDFQDSGGGILPENADKLFRTDFSTKGAEGSGFGLPICRRIIEEMHKGKISYIPEITKYTTFRIVLYTNFMRES